MGIIPATLVNYFLNSYWTFRDSPRRAVDPPGPDTGK
jgi:putative flippase GtrA